MHLKEEIEVPLEDMLYKLMERLDKYWEVLDQRLVQLETVIKMQDDMLRENGAAMKNLEVQIAQFRETLHHESQECSSNATLSNSEVQLVQSPYISSSISQHDSLHYSVPTSMDCDFEVNDSHNECISKCPREWESLHVIDNFEECINDEPLLNESNIVCFDNEETSHHDPYVGLCDEDMSIYNEIADIVNSCVIKMMHTETPLLDDNIVQCVDVVEVPKTEYHVSLDKEDLHIFHEIANMVETCFIDTSIFEITDDFIETMDAKPLVDSCSSNGVEEKMTWKAEKPLEIPKLMVEEEKEEPTLEEQEWYKVEFIELAPQMHELKFLLKWLQKKPYARRRSACERAFFWYKDGYSES